LTTFTHQKSNSISIPYVKSEISKFKKNICANNKDRRKLINIEEKLKIKNKKPDDKMKRSILCKGQLFGEESILDLVRHKETQPAYFSVSSLSADGLLLHAPIAKISRILYHES
jgi:hypothetical protein